MNNQSINIGVSNYRGSEKIISIPEADRFRHCYVVGKTGVGKSTLFQNMILEDIVRSRGVCFIDPHGEAIDWILERIPESRLDDVILFDPSDTEFPVGLNLLEASDNAGMEFLVNELILIFYKLFDPEKTGIIGPQFEHWLRNGALTMAANGGTLLDIPRLFTDQTFLNQMLVKVSDPIVREFWTKQMAKTSDFHRSEMLNYFTSKFGHFSASPLMRNILGQKTSTISFDEIIAKEKILLINLSKGKIGELNAYALGLITIAKLQAAVLRRANMPQENRYPFYLYVDEFQTVVTDTFASMLSESRKYGPAVHLTNQYIAQLPKNVKEAVLGNVGQLISFTIGMEDAEILAKEFYPLEPEDFVTIPKFSFYARLVIDGGTTRPFSGQSLPPIKIKPESSSGTIKTISQLAYGVPKLLIEGMLQRGN